MRPFYTALFALLVLLTPVRAEETPLGANKVEGLELPPDMKVAEDEGFTVIQAKCKGDVKWLVVSAFKIKYIPIPGNNLILSIPKIPLELPPGQDGIVLTVFAVGLAEGKLTEFARTNVLVVRAGPQPPVPPVPKPPIDPPPKPPVDPPKPPVEDPVVAKGHHVTFVVDVNNPTPALAQVLNSQTMRQAVLNLVGENARLYHFQSPEFTRIAGLPEAYKKAGGGAVVIVQRPNGVIAGAAQIPATEAELLKYINFAIFGAK